MGVYLLLVVLSVLVNLAGVLVALDARDRGMTKIAAVLWYFAVVILFGLPAALYMMTRNSGASKPGPGAPPPPPVQPPAQSRRFCPYCGEPQDADSKICPACRKFL